MTVPGHTQRGGSPCPYDRVLSTRIGSEAAKLIMEEQYGYMVGIVNGKVKKVPLAECAGKLKMVEPGLPGGEWMPRGWASASETKM